MLVSRGLFLAGLTALSAASAFADPANHLVINFGDISVPFTHSFGDTFSGSQGAGFVSEDGHAVVTTNLNGKNYFYDDFVFSLPASPQADFNAAAVSLNLGNFLSLLDFSARLYKLDNGLASLTTGTPSSGTPIRPWTSTALVQPGMTGTLVLIDNVTLQAGASYALEVRGTIAGTNGGSYGGNLNIVPTPVPEPTSLALMLASIGVMVMVSNRRRF